MCTHPHPQLLHTHTHTHTTHTHTHPQPPSKHTRTRTHTQSQVQCSPRASAPIDFSHTTFFLQSELTLWSLIQTNKTCKIGSSCFLVGFFIYNITRHADILDTTAFEKHLKKKMTKHEMYEMRNSYNKHVSTAFNKAGRILVDRLFITCIRLLVMKTQIIHFHKEPVQISQS